MDQSMENNNMKKRNMKKTTAKALVITGAICLATVGGVSAFLTDYDKATNQFTVGKVDIDLDEPGWKPEDHTKLEPGEVISKDPQITNTGTNDAFTYLEVSVPRSNCSTGGRNQTANEITGTVFFYSQGQLDKTGFQKSWRFTGICIYL